MHAALPRQRQQRAAKDQTVEATQHRADRGAITRYEATTASSSIRRVAGTSHVTQEARRLYLGLGVNPRARIFGFND